jgi:hypothetical protein
MALTLIRGDRWGTFDEHPVQVARSALIAAADLEGEDDAVRHCKAVAQ